MRDWFRDLAADAGADDLDRTSEELLIVLNGAYATAAVLDGPNYGERALNLARRLIADACTSR